MSNKENAPYDVIFQHYKVKHAHTTSQQASVVWMGQQPPAALSTTWWTSRRVLLSVSASYLAAPMLCNFNSKHGVINVLHSLHEICHHCQHCRHVKTAFIRIAATHGWPVVMAAGTSEPNLAETSSPLSSTLAALSWGDIQPEPGAAEELWQSGSSSWFIFPQCRSYALSCRRRVCGQNLQHCIVINPLKDHKHAHGFCYLIRQPRRRRQRAINVFHMGSLT